MKGFKIIVGILILVVFSFGCKSKTVATNSSLKVLSANKVVRNHYNNSFKQKTITARMKVKYKGKENLPSITASLRMGVDKTIWINLSKLGFPIGKVLITKDRVSYYEKINKTYFDGDFELLSNWLGTELDFDKVQNLLLGQALLNMKKESHHIKIKEENYQLSLKKPYELFDIFYLINPEHFKVDRQFIQQVNQSNLLTIDYSNYETIEGELFPKKIVLTSKNDKETTTVDVEYRSVVFNKEVYFPFAIPEGYKEIKLK